MLTSLVDLLFPFLLLISLDKLNFFITPLNTLIDAFIYFLYRISKWDCTTHLVAFWGVHSSDAGHLCPIKLSILANYSPVILINALDIQRLNSRFVLIGYLVVILCSQDIGRILSHGLRILLLLIIPARLIALIIGEVITIGLTYGRHSYSVLHRHTLKLGINHALIDSSASAWGMRILIVALLLAPGVTLTSQILKISHASVARLGYLVLCHDLRYIEVILLLLSIRHE